MLCAKLRWNLLKSSGEDENENLHTADGCTDRQMDRRRTYRQTDGQTTDVAWSEKTISCCCWFYLALKFQETFVICIKEVSSLPLFVYFINI